MCEVLRHILCKLDRLERENRSVLFLSGMSMFAMLGMHLRMKDMEKKLNELAADAEITTD